MKFFSFRSFSRQHANGFTLIEALLAMFIFGLLIIVLFNLITFTGRLSNDNRDTVMISQKQENGIQLIKAKKSELGWTNFLQSYMGQGNFSIVWTDTPTPGYVFSSAGSSTQTEGEWRFSIRADESLGPYLERITSYDTPPTPNFEFTFSQPILAKSEELSELFPIINTTTHAWTNQVVSPVLDVSDANSLINVASNSLSIALNAAADIPVSGDRVLPSREIVDEDGNADMTYAQGVSIPAANASETGYPAVAKLTLTVVVRGQSYTVSDYLSEKDF